MSGDVPSSITLDHGDLLVMDGSAQSEYAHRTVPGLQGPRVNLTYRWVTQTRCVLSICSSGLCSPNVCARSRHPGLVNGCLLLVSFRLNLSMLVDGWTYGDLALDSCAQFFCGC